jgi:predicted enzyme related to lactoylglutathione lyase
MLKDSYAFSGFSVNDSDAALQFYGETLGLAIAQSDMGLELSIQGNTTPIFIYTKQDHTPAAYTILNFPVENIDQTVDELASKGIVFERYEGFPFDQDERAIARGKAAGQGPDIAWFKDPAGNTLAVLQN